MLYKKNHSPALDKDLFKNPTSEYRGAPFWAWNCQLDKDDLTEQISVLKEMGFGGFHMHTRSGMSTRYLSDDYMNLVKTCVDKARDENMLAWLYDEDRWPSGAAGGFVTKTKKYRQKFLCFSKELKEEMSSKEKGTEDGLPYLLSCYDVILNENGELQSYKVISQNDNAEGDKWYAYVCTATESGWYNNQTYIDALSKEAVDEFIRLTHEAYKRTVGKDFGDIVPAIFTDEPRFANKTALPFAKTSDFASMPWTTNLDKSYYEKYKIDLIAALPELFWNLPNRKPSKARYCFHDHVCELFVESYMENCSKWCRENGISLTGHVFEEQTLISQSDVIGEAMRAYYAMGIPGIDILCDHIELTTAKQAQSIVHQCGKEGMISELYGVTNWDFDFRGYKFQGDWQAALGVTIRVPHLSWVSMKGSAKRDFPASFNYQAPWYKEYGYIEDHFARLNTVLTRGKPVISVGVIHPIESDWLHTGPTDTDYELRCQMQENHENITQWLLFGLIDFNFISESLLENNGSVDGKYFVAGEMKYSTVIVPGCETLRSSTLEKLQKFRNMGGNLIFCGDCPRYVDAKESDLVNEIYNKSIRIPFSRYNLLNAVDNERFLDIREEAGRRNENFIHAVRKDGDVTWLFIAHGKKNVKPTPFSGKNKDVAFAENMTIELKGEYIPHLYNTLNGEITKIPCTYENGCTFIPATFYENDCMLIELTEGRCENPQNDAFEKDVFDTIRFHKGVSYEKEEPNVYLLDMAEYKLDDGEFQPTEEILRIDEKCRKILNYPMANGLDTQPWLLSEENEVLHTVTLRYTINSEYKTNSLKLAAEELTGLSLNGCNIELNSCGYYVDKSIITYEIPCLKKGINILEAKVPLGKRLSVECMYLLGDFGVTVAGTSKTITTPPQTLHYGDIAKQGLPFYSGNLIYRTEFDATDDCSAEIFVGKYRGALIKVLLDGEDVGKIVFPPYKLKIDNIKKGKHKISFVLYGNRANTFASMHNYNGSPWYGPGHWYAKDETGFCYEYCLKETGILTSPIIRLMK